MRLLAGTAAGLRSFVLLGCSVRHCSGLYDPVHHIASARIYGNVDFYAYYFVDLLIGTPPQRVSVIIDTGSGVTAFPCKYCRHCGHHIDPAFDFDSSSTAKWIRCGGEDCRGSCSGDHCGYHQGYTEGSSISGWWFRDVVRLGDSIQRNPPVNTALGCHHDETKLFYTQKANGIMGIRPPGRGAPTVLQELFADHAHIDSDVFALCLAEWGGRIVVGGYNASYHTGTVAYAPLTTSSGYYSVPLMSMSVGGQVISSRFGRTIIDSGTTYVYMATRPYRALRGAIESYCRDHSSCGARPSGTCWELPSGSAGLDLFPIIEVAFDGAMTAWVPAAYLYQKGSTPRWCYAFEDDGETATTTVLGAAWMLQQEVIFDLRAKRVGIAPARCPEFRERPEHNPQADLSLPEASPGAAGLNAATTMASLQPSTGVDFTGAPSGKSLLQEWRGVAAGVGVVVSFGALVGWAARACKKSTVEAVAATTAVPATVVGAETDGKEDSNENLSDEEDPLIAAPREKL